MPVKQTRSDLIVATKHVTPWVFRGASITQVGFAGAQLGMRTGLPRGPDFTSVQVSYSEDLPVKREDYAIDITCQAPFPGRSAGA